ncbi:hypothetical protein IEQ34_024048 [Dendrobium chrysotoxum]|uniref:Uncharacterized protein n=1 Tax=Dendrobium chrysotoxum TaxID=161865 RepID=A0AAV7FTC4_DENCH|nr:hypothetical protein IEQ34_024912 [Dendrobium chrysotoxum]KAH0447024.1 hypothetical protein IEQ34_024141 [Dendrobium chrysotoxum]KAH0447133.1 hypothetical protein IEQ34_024048 [Dendrobium chrysotoxum]
MFLHTPADIIPAAFSSYMPILMKSPARPGFCDRMCLSCYTCKEPTDSPQMLFHLSLVKRISSLTLSSSFFVQVWNSLPELRK